MSKIIKTYNQLPPKVKQSINNVAAKAATSAVKQVQNSINRNRQSKARNRTTRTRNGMRIYSPNDVVESKAVAPVSYATTWTSGNRSLRVHQTEVIGKVSANSTWFPSWNDKYSVATFPINPANPRTFPWLSYIARLYDKYRFYGLKFMFVNAVSTQTEGNLMMSLDYDTLDAAPANLVQASQLAKYKVSPLYCPCEFSIPVSHPGNSNWLYTFDLSATTNTVDLKTYNLGNFFLSLDGVPQDGKDYGYLAVEYDVELLDKNPVIDTFASKTYDSSGLISKRNRSNVDPADTMEVTLGWSQPSSTGLYNSDLTIGFSEDVGVGSKVRASVYLTAPVTSSSSAPINFGAPTVDDSTTLIEYNLPSFNSAGGTATGWFNFDIEVPKSRTCTVTVPIASGSYNTAASSTSNYKAYCTAFTYA
jgi:hypothetical protein